MKEDKKIKLPKVAREVKVNNPKILKFLLKRDALAKSINRDTEDIEKIQKEQRKKGMKMNRLKEKMKPFVEKEDLLIGKNEWERVTQIKLRKGEIIFEIVDFIASYKLKLTESLKDKNGKKH